MKNESRENTSLGNLIRRRRKFLISVGDVLSIGGGSLRSRGRAIMSKNDIQSLAADFSAIGRDFREAINIIEQKDNISK